MKLHDFSEVYGIKESALRYWEKAGILSAKRMENQKYRDLSTNISRLLYLDILYYRKNGVAVKDMTDFDKMDEEQIYEMLEKTETKLDEQLALLNRQRDNLRQRQCMIKFLRDFGKKPYRLVKLPDLCLVTESEPYTRLLADNFPQSIITELDLSTLETVTQPVAINRACIVSDRLKGKYRQMEVDLNARFVMTKYKEVLAGEALYTNGKKNNRRHKKLRFPTKEVPDKHRIFVPQQGQRLYERVSCVCSGRGRRQNPRRLQNRFGGNNQSSRIK